MNFNLLSETTTLSIYSIVKIETVVTSTIRKISLADQDKLGSVSKEKLISEMDINNCTKSSRYFPDLEFTFSRVFFKIFMALVIEMKI